MQRRDARASAPAAGIARIERQLANLHELYIAANITREEYVGRTRALEAALQSGRGQPTYSEAVLAKAARLPADLGGRWVKAAHVERAEIAACLCAEVRARDQQSVEATLADEAYLPLVASAAAGNPVVLARPEVSGFTT